MPKLSAPLQYYGSDSVVAPKIASLLNSCKHVSIPFCGGLGILKHLTARAIVANDLNHHAINFFRIARSDKSQALYDMCSNTLSHPGSLQHAVDVLNPSRNSDAMSLAWAFWTVCWVGLKGAAGTGRKPATSVRWSAVGGNNASRIRSAAEDIERWAEEFRRCEFTCLDFRAFLPRVPDKSAQGVYCDPPWFSAGKAYQHSFSDSDHKDLYACLQRFQNSTVVVRYGNDSYTSDLYSSWYRQELKSRNQANNSVTEVLFSNKPFPEVHLQ